MAFMNPIAIIHGIIGVALMCLSWPLAKRKIRRNHWYGIRIPAAFESEERWLEINQYGGRLLIGWGIVVAVVAGIGLMLPRKEWIIFDVGSPAVMVGGLAIVFIFIFRYAAKTAAGRVRPADTGEVKGGD